MDAIITRVIDMPLGVKGVTVKDENDDYNIYLNSRYSPDVQAEAFRHEIDHIRKNHFFDERPVKEKEADIEDRKSPK